VREDESLFAALRAHPEDETLRLVYADWLEERGDLRGEWLRTQVALDRLTAEGRWDATLADRRRQLGTVIDPVWLAVARLPNRLDIHPGEGIGPVRLGMRPAELLAAFPEPRVYESWMGGNLNDALVFHGLRLHFSDCDSRAPLPDSTLNWVVIHQREDAYLFERTVEEWTRHSVLRELRARGYDARTPPNGDVEVPRQIGMSFDEDGRLIWVEV
jgi:uncharacterized protein (TIGR02996 family)